MFTFDITIQRRRTRHIQFEIRTHAARGHTADGGTCIVHSRASLRSSRSNFIQFNPPRRHRRTNKHRHADMRTIHTAPRCARACSCAGRAALAEPSSHVCNEQEPESKNARQTAGLCAPHFSCATAVAQAATVPSLVLVILSSSHPARRGEW